MTEQPTALAADLVGEFVRVAHTDLERVMALAEQTPTLVNASWDWGGGDWETALGAAAHMGRRDIAEYLLARGARLDIFAAAALDEVDIVKAVLARYPESRRAPGPHGISLEEHAQAGKATAVLALLGSQ